MAASCMVQIHYAWLAKAAFTVQEAYRELHAKQENMGRPEGQNVRQRNIYTNKYKKQLCKLLLLISPANFILINCQTYLRRSKKRNSLRCTVHIK